MSYNDETYHTIFHECGEFINAQSMKYTFQVICIGMDKEVELDIKLVWGGIDYDWN